MPKEYYLIAGTSEAEVERLTGLRGRMTDLGVLVEKPQPFDIESAMIAFNRAQRGPPCCSGGVIHSPWCKVGNAIS